MCFGCDSPYNSIYSLEIKPDPRRVEMMVYTVHEQHQSHRQHRHESYAIRTTRLASVSVDSRVNRKWQTFKIRIKMTGCVERKTQQVRGDNLGLRRPGCVPRAGFATKTWHCFRVKTKRIKMFRFGKCIGTELFKEVYLPWYRHAPSNIAISHSTCKEFANMKIHPWSVLKK